MERQEIDNYKANWFDKNHIGFVNLILYTLCPHSNKERNELVLSRPKQADEMNSLWPRPWLYLRTFLIMMAGMMILYVCWRLEHRYESSALLPGITVLGSLIVPITLLIFFWELNKWRSLTLLDVLRSLLLGSCIAIAITFLLQYFLDYLPDENLFNPDKKLFNNESYSITLRQMLDYGLTPVAITALTEEFAKAVTIYIMLFLHRKECRILQGVLTGAAVGAGFAVFESAGYIFSDPGNLLSGIIIRSLTAPACHVAWGALIGGAMAMATKGKFRLLTMLKPLSVIAFAFVCLLHFCWNYLIDTSITINRNVELSVVTWFFLLLLIRQGLHEIERIKAQS